MPIRYFLSSMFARSPIGPIQEHLSISHHCVMKLEPLFHEVFNENWEQVNLIQKEIKILESKADKLKKHVRTSIPSNLFLPVPRTDLLEIISVQDKVANRAQDIAGIITGRQMQIPASIKDNFMTFLLRAISASKQALMAVAELDNLLEAGFRGREVKFVKKIIEELDKIETKTDLDQVLVRQKLFKIEDDLNPIHVFFLYKIIDWIGDLADRALRVGNHLLILLAH